MERLSLQTQTAYAELLEQLTALEAQRAMGSTSGSFVRKAIKGQEYWYFQHSGPAGVVQRYVGRRTPDLDRVVERFESGRLAASAERGRLEQLCAVLRAGGAAGSDAAATRVLAALADAAVFRLGGVLVGTQAFLVLGNVLGVRWDGSGVRTEDVDVAGERTLDVTVPGLKADVPSVLDSLEMGFLPVPGLSHGTPSTSFKVRGKALRVDLLTQQLRGERKPVLLPRFAAAAQPLPYLQYLTDKAIAAAVVGGSGVLVNVPAPARFALHKLIVARARPSTMQAKSDKDLHQAAQLVLALTDERPGDLRLAWRAMGRHGWQKTAGRGIAALGRRHPDAAKALARETK
jgi:hypothetical protein